MTRSRPPLASAHAITSTRASATPLASRRASTAPARTAAGSSGPSILEDEECRTRLHPRSAFNRGGDVGRFRFVGMAGFELAIPGPMATGQLRFSEAGAPLPVYEQVEQRR